MNIMKTLVVVCSVIILVMTQSVSAAPRGKGKAEVRALTAALKKQQRSRKEFARKWRRASADSQNKVIDQLVSRGSDDSDQDGLPDDIDNGDVEGTEQCLSDSDGDGLDDGAEVEDGLDPSDDDSDGDGISDSRDNKEAKGTASYAAPLLTVTDPKDGSQAVFTLVFEPEPNPTQFEGVGPESLNGACVEVEGFSDGETLVAARVKGEDSCGDQGGGGDDHGGDDHGGGRDD
jgi:hypothetical protein